MYTFHTLQKIIHENCNCKTSICFYTFHNLQTLSSLHFNSFTIVLRYRVNGIHNF